MRCVDPIHLAFLTNLRLGNTNGLVDYVRGHMLSASDTARFQDTPIISQGNPERIHFNPLVLTRFARRTNHRIISWRLQATWPPRRGGNRGQGGGGGRGARSQAFSEPNFLNTIASMTNQATANAASNSFPQLLQHFVPGAQVVLTENINPSRGIANGSPVILHSLGWNNDAQLAAVNLFLANNPGDVILPVEMQPTRVFVRVLLRPGADARWPSHLSATEIVEVPNAGDVRIIVIPLVPIRNDQLLHTDTVEIRVNVQSFPYDLTYLATVHSQQGHTTATIVTNLLQRPTAPSRSEYHGFYTALSRVTAGLNFRVLANTNDLSFIHTIRPPNNLLAFEAGYGAETGMWDYARAQAALVRLSNAPRGTRNRGRGRISVRGINGPVPLSTTSGSLNTIGPLPSPRGRGGGTRRGRGSTRARRGTNGITHGHQLIGNTQVPIAAPSTTNSITSTIVSSPILSTNPRRRLAQIPPTPVPPASGPNRGLFQPPPVLVRASPNSIWRPDRT